MEKNSNIKKKKLIIFCSLFFVLCSLFFLWQGIYLPKEPGTQETKTFSVKKGEGTKEISINLEKQGLIKYGFLFRLYTLTFGVADKLQAGDYLLSPGMTIPEITKKLVSGEVIKNKITIIEGWNLKDIALYLQEKGFGQKEKFFELVNNPKNFSQEFDFLKDKPENLSLEGYLFPDTYEVNKGDSLENIIRKILANFDKKLTSDLREEIAKQNKTIFEIVTMASLIEKEVYNTPECPDCKNLVSGILWKRLENKIPLQVDATIAYLTGKKTTKISIEETKIDSPYNTYKYLGLPPGPICNPGLESILAALYPKNSDYWYYLSTPDGKTIFSKTLEDHNLAKIKYLK